MLPTHLSTSTDPSAAGLPSASVMVIIAIERATSRPQQTLSVSRVK